MSGCTYSCVHRAEVQPAVKKKTIFCRVLTFKWHRPAASAKLHNGLGGNGLPGSLRAERVPLSRMPSSVGDAKPTFDEDLARTRLGCS